MSTAVWLSFIFTATLIPVFHRPTIIQVTTRWICSGRRSILLQTIKTAAYPLYSEREDWLQKQKLPHNPVLQLTTIHPQILKQSRRMAEPNLKSISYSVSLFPQFIHSYVPLFGWLAILENSPLAQNSFVILTRFFTYQPHQPSRRTIRHWFTTLMMPNIPFKMSMRK